jgi:sRNA-binding regulator protein Hfq
MTRIRHILAFLITNPNSLREEIVKGLGVENNEIEGDLTSLIKDGYILKKSFITSKETGGTISRTKLSISPKGLQLFYSLPENVSAGIDNNNIKNDVKKIFLSHSYKDRKIADRIIKHLILPIFEIDKKDIFYTSNRETGIEISINWRNKIKGYLKACDIYIALITPNFQESEMCQNELGAAWVLDKTIFPRILSPVSYSNFSILISDLQALELSRSENIKSFLNSLRNKLKEKQIIITNGGKIEDHIRKFDKSLRSFLRNNQGIFNVNKHEKTVVTNLKNNSPIRHGIIERSKKEWPEDYEMQEYYIQNQVNALKQIQSLPSKYRNKNLIEIIINKARQQWPEDYEMQLYTARQQIEAYQRIK